MFKKVIVATALLLTLAACTKAPPPLSNRSPAEPETSVTVQGMVQPIPLSLYQKGTHLLTTQDGREIMIASPTVNLNNYLDGPVEVKGAFETGAIPEEKVLIVTSARPVNEGAAESKEYQSRTLGLKFTHPGDWALTEEAGAVRLRREGEEAIRIEWFSSSEPLIDFIKSREIEDGTEISVGGVPARRFTAQDGIRVYAKSPQGAVIRLTQMSPSPEKTEEIQRVFYDLLGSVMFLSYQKPAGPECGGPEAKGCDTGFRCERDSGEQDAKGVCVDINAAPIQSICPLVTPPVGCQNFQPSAKNADGCPVSYECLDVKTEKKTEPSDPTPQTTGYRLQTTDSSDLTRSYENTFKNFKISYHKNWYFQSFGATENTVWTVGFSDSILKELADALILLKIVEGSQADRRGKTEGGVYTFFLPRDDSTHFILEGPSSFQSLIEEMAQSLSSPLPPSP